MPDAIEVRKVPLHTVSDASELGTLIDEGVFEADRVIAVIGKTEGNGGVQPNREWESSDNDLANKSCRTFPPSTGCSD